jgi:hypothetical protein
MAASSSHIYLESPHLRRMELIGYEIESRQFKLQLHISASSV